MSLTGRLGRVAPTMEPSLWDASERSGAVLAPSQLVPAWGTKSVPDGHGADRDWVSRPQLATGMDYAMPLTFEYRAQE